eukprot:605339_1
MFMIPRNHQCTMGINKGNAGNDQIYRDRIDSLIVNVMHIGLMYEIAMRNCADILMMTISGLMVIYRYEPQRQAIGYKNDCKKVQEHGIMHRKQNITSKTMNITREEPKEHGIMHRKQNITSKTMNITREEPKEHGIMHRKQNITSKTMN